MQRCTQCIMTDTVPGITFDDQGLCSYCREFKKESYRGKEALDAIVAAARGKGQPYDCIVPLSGGRDSAYVLYLARKVYDLKVLAVNYNNEFQNPQALKNMQNACQRLQADFVSVRSRTNLAREIVRYGLKSSNLRRKYCICTACAYGMHSVVYRAAIEHRAPLIFWGDSQQEQTTPMERQARETLKLGKDTFRKHFNPDYYRYEWAFLKQRREFKVPGNPWFVRRPKLKDKHIKEVHVFYYIPWDRQLIKKTIQEETGWEKPAGSVSTWRTDCYLTPLLNYFFYQIFSCGKETFGYCKMINSGDMDREEALQQEEAFQKTILDVDVIRKMLEEDIGLSRREADRVLSCAPAAAPSKHTPGQ